MKDIWFWLRGVLAALILAILLGGSWLYWSWQPRGEVGQKVVIIAPGMSLADISQLLVQEKLIRSSWGFRLWAYYAHLQGKLQAGKFVLDGHWSVAKIGRALAQGRLDRWLRVPEGWRREQIAALVHRQLHLDGYRFLSLSRGREGYLFPDTYLIPPYYNEDQILTLLEKTFRQKTASWQEKRSRQGLSEKEWLVLASLVEREAKFAADRPRVAAVLLNRWRAGWPLQVDATVQYAKASRDCQRRLKCNWWPKVGHQDLKIASPYNTYLRPGLPPGPICNPSLAALVAVTTAPKTNDWYYVSDQQGHLHFAATLAEHQANIRRYLK